MKITNDFNVPRSEWERLIDEWIFNEQHREMLKLNLLDGWTYERLSEKFEMSTRQIARIIPKLQNQLLKRIK